MTLKDLCKEKKINLKQLSIATGLPYSTINDIVNGKVAIDNVAFGKCKKIAEHLNISLEELYVISHTDGKIAITKDAYVYVKGQKYFLHYDEKDMYMFKVKQSIKPYVKQIALEEIQRIKEEKKFEQIAKTILNQKRHK